MVDRPLLDEPPQVVPAGQVGVAEVDPPGLAPCRGTAVHRPLDPVGELEHTLWRDVPVDDASEVEFVVEVEEGGRFQPGGREEAVVGEYLLRRPPGEDAPLFHEHDRVGPAIGEFDVVGGYEHRPAAGGEFVEEFHHLLRACGVKGVRRFVEDENRRFHREDAGDGDPFLLAAGEVVGRPLLVAPEPDVAERVMHRLPDGVGRVAEVHRAEGHVCFDGRCDDLDVGVLEDEPDPAPEFAEAPVVVGERLAGEADLA